MRDRSPAGDYVKDATILERMALEQDHRISEVVKREQSRLRNVIRRRLPDPRDAEDLLKDVYSTVPVAQLSQALTAENAEAAQAHWPAFGSRSSDSGCRPVTMWTSRQDPSRSDDEIRCHLALSLQERIEGRSSTWT